jgi:hypothetical protein
LFVGLGEARRDRAGGAHGAADASDEAGSGSGRAAVAS